MEKIIIIDPEKCLSCKSCELACAIEHSKTKKLEEAILESPPPQSRIFVKPTDTEHPQFHELKITKLVVCYHCEDAPCIKTCRIKAIEKLPEGEVIINLEKCVGCKRCISACPYGVIKFDLNRKKAIKCDLCIDRQKEGKKTACISACPTKALKYNTHYTHASK